MNPASIGSGSTRLVAGRSHRRLITAALACALAVAGCGLAGPASPSLPPLVPPSDAPSAGPSADPSAAASLSPEELEALYDEIEQQVVAMRGLEAKGDVVRTVVDEEGILQYGRRVFEEDTPADYLAAYERFYQAMGQLEPDVDLKAEYLRMLATGALGIYDPDEKRIYVVARTGAVGPVQRATYAHEYDHAIQDQHFDSNDILLDDALDQGDATLAGLSLIEGDAYLLMTLWVEETMTPDELMTFLAEAQDPDTLAIMQTIPSVIRDPLEFPAENGLLFVLDAFQKGGWDAVNALYDRPPASTEQVLHVEKYEANEEPVKVTLPSDLASAMGTGWSEAFQDTYGEFGLRQWLRQVVPSLTTADTAADVAAAGWGGDRVVFLQGPSDAWAAAVVSEWDSAADADEFATQAALAADTLDGEHAVVRPSESRVAVLLGSDAGALTSIRSGLGVGS